MRVSKILMLAGATLFVGYVFYSLYTVEPVRVVQSRLEHVAGGVFVDGEVRNTGAKDRTVDLEVHYFDRTGRALGQDTLKLADLPPGRMKAFRTPSRIVQGVSDFSIYLNHGRDPYGN
ncbi:MAG TPA: FxLYD domain-containing protein [Candidatus Binataceae bacterium]|nr:FxLYD domain-containing protein [Candidatus Binataceae bacterium]